MVHFRINKYTLERKKKKEKGIASAKWSYIVQPKRKLSRI